MEGHLSQRQYAERRGCSEGAVRKAIRAGKIIHGLVKDAKGRPWINPDVADREWSQNHNPNYAHNNPVLAEKLQSQPAQTPSAPTAPASEGTDSPDVEARASISKHKQAESAIKAKLLHLKLQEQQGQVVKKSDISNSLYEMGQEIRKELMGIPARHIDRLRGISDRNQQQIYLEEAIASALEKITQVISRDL